MLGGFSQKTDPQSKADALQLLEKHKNDLVAKGVANWSGVEVVSVESQVVAGTNFRITFKSDGKQYQTTVFRPLPPSHENTEVTAFEASN